MMPKRGLTLLEVLVALVVLTLVVVGYLELFHQSHQLVGGARTWSDAVAYAEDAMEQTRLGNLGLPSSPVAAPEGFRRAITRRPWQPGFLLVTVTVLLPEGGRFDLNRLVKLRTDADSGGPSEEW